MEKIDKNHKTYDCGVMATFEQDASGTSNIELRLDYYGLIQNIIEVNYRIFSHFILEVRWFKVIKTQEEMPRYAVIQNDTFVFSHQYE